MKQLSAIVIVIFFLLSCSSIRKPYVYDVCVRQEADSSIVMQNKIIGIADTVIAYVTGQVIDKKTKEPIKDVTITLNDHQNNKITGTVTDSTGYYQLITNAGLHDFKISYFGYSDLKLDSVKLGTGEIREVDAALGQGDLWVWYKIESEKRLSSKELEALANNKNNKHTPTTE